MPLLSQATFLPFLRHSGEADAVGYVYRKKNETHISFEGGDNSVIEARAPHLRGKNIVVAESDENNNITTYWNKVYLPE